MTDKETNNNNTSRVAQASSYAPPGNKKNHRALGVILSAFVIFVLAVFLTQKKTPINWVEDYDTGIELAKKQNKPALLAFYKKHTRFSSTMWQKVYNDPGVKEFVEENYVPILIDVDKQPDIARSYQVAYYPTHYVVYPDSNDMAGPFAGAHRLFHFIQENVKPHPKENDFNQK